MSSWIAVDIYTLAYTYSSALKSSWVKAQVSFKMSTPFTPASAFHMTPAQGFKSPMVAGARDIVKDGNFMRTRRIAYA